MTVQKYRLPSGQEILVEVDHEVDLKPVRSGTRGLRSPDVPTLDPDCVIEPVLALVTASLNRLLLHTPKPNEIEFSAGIKLGVEGGVVVAKGSAEANLTVSLKYVAADFLKQNG
jgi:hypothetical protein